MISRILPSVRMVGRGIGRHNAARLSSIVSSACSFGRVSSADQENGDGCFAAMQKSFALESKNG